MTTTNAGNDYLSAVAGSTTSNGTGAYAPANWIGLSSDTGTPAATDTVLPSEVTSGALKRAQATYTHTAGTNTYTLSCTFISDQSIVIAKMGVFNASSGGTLVFETLLSTPATLVSGDELVITETITI